MYVWSVLSDILQDKRRFYNNTSVLFLKLAKYRVVLSPIPRDFQNRARGYRSNVECHAGLAVLCEADATESKKQRKGKTVMMAWYSVIFWRLSSTVCQVFKRDLHILFLLICLIILTCFAELVQIQKRYIHTQNFNPFGSRFRVLYWI